MDCFAPLAMTPEWLIRGNRNLSNPNDAAAMPLKFEAY
jgi:hypothetical protein